MSALGIYAISMRAYHATVGRDSAVEKEKLREFYAPLLQNARLVFDIGANRGFYALVFASLGTRVVALEPNPDCVRHIQLTYPDVEVLQAVAGPKDGLAELNLSDGHDDMSSLSGEWIKTIRAYRDEDDLWNRKLRVPMLRIDTLIEHYGRPDYIKIDVEGFEEGVLDGLSVCPALLSFEYNLTFLEAAFRCLDKPMFKGASFNFTAYYKREFHSKGEWMDVESIKAILPTLGSGDVFGDIFVRKL